MNVITNFIGKFFKACLLYFKRGFDFRGRSCRMEMWAGSLIVFLLVLFYIFVLSAVSLPVLITYANNAALSAAQMQNYIYFVSVFSIILGFGVLLFSTSLAVRRFHDMGYSGLQLLWYLFIPMLFCLIGYGVVYFIGAINAVITIVGFLILFFVLYLYYLLFYCHGGTYRNAWGDVPKL